MAQRAEGSLRGTVTDASGAVIPSAKVEARNEESGLSRSTFTTPAGVYWFPSLITGRYAVWVTAAGFQQYERLGVEVLPNRFTSADAQLAVTGLDTQLDVPTVAEVVGSGTSQLAYDFGARAVSEMPNPGLGNSAMNLALLLPNTTSQGAGVLGEGGSIGGVRPRMNAFTIDGVDDDRADTTGHISEVIPEAVADFNVVTNLFSADIGHSAGGQFNLVTRSGGNHWHGAAWEFNNNRGFNAMDNLEKSSGLTQPRRYDRNRAGGMLGGPVIPGKLFVFGAYQFYGVGLAAGSVAMNAPTAQGLASLKSMAANDAVRNILDQFPTAPAANGPAEIVNGMAIPVGSMQASAPSYLNEHDFNLNVDLNAGNHQLRWRFLFNRQRQPNLNPETPLAQFTGDFALDSRKFIFTHDWNLRDRLLNTLRVSFGRFVQAYTVPARFANFPNVEIDSLGINAGPFSQGPQSYVQNSYQVLDSLSVVHGRHIFKFGPEFRRWIAPTNFLPRSRGEWDYGNLQTLVNDLVPNGINGAFRGAGSGLFNGNQQAWYGYFLDDWQVSPSFTLNMGLRYEWNSNAAGVKSQALNAAASLPGVFEFREPKTDRDNFMPRVGFAWNLPGSAATVLRGGFGVSYDVTPQNFAILGLPPQLQTQQDPGLTCSLAPRPAWCASYLANTGGAGFLAGGGLLAVNVPPVTQAAARAATQGIILDTVQPRVLTWTLSVERELARDTSLELRYLGTRSDNLIMQARINTTNAFDAGMQPLPTYLNPAQIPAVITGGSRLEDFENFNPLIHPEFNLMTAFTNLGSGIYHGASLALNHRMRRGLLLNGNYTWSHNIDNATNELVSSRVNPRRPFNWNKPELDRADSALDARHKLAIAWIYDFPKKSFENSLLQMAVNGWQWTGNFLAQSGQPVTILSGTDANGDFDAAADRAIVNPNGAASVGSTTSYVCAGLGVQPELPPPWQDAAAASLSPDMLRTIPQRDISRRSWALSQTWDATATARPA
jgi:hypothetical protein